MDRLRVLSPTSDYYSAAAVFTLSGTQDLNERLTGHDTIDSAKSLSPLRLAAPNDQDVSNHRALWQKTTRP